MVSYRTGALLVFHAVIVLQLVMLPNDDFNWLITRRHLGIKTQKLRRYQSKCQLGVSSHPVSTNKHWAVGTV